MHAPPRDAVRGLERVTSRYGPFQSLNPNPRSLFLFFPLIAKTFFGLEPVLADELLALGATEVARGRRMVAFQGDRQLMYRVNLYARTAVRVLKPIGTFTAGDDQALYRGVSEIDWREHLDVDSSLAVDPVVHSPIFGNSLYAAQRAKDAIVDQMRAAGGRRPSVDLVDPDLRINLHIDGDRATIYLDASGDSLHKRGYRAATGVAPMNEVLAAGILRLAGWNEDATAPLADFMCGSGTLVIEAALAARRIAPGLLRKRFGYLRWKDVDRPLHDRLVAEARERVLADLPFPLAGSDLDPKAIAAARENADRAGVDSDITWSVANFESARPPAARGILVSNPPYDERMKAADIGAVYRRIGNALKQQWGGWTSYLFSGNLDAARQIGLRPTARIRLFNGPIECRLLEFRLTAPAREISPREASRRHEEHLGAFRNRLARMAKHWSRWARRQGITCYRLYDRDLPEVPLAIDVYEDQVAMSAYRRAHGRTELEQRAWLDTLSGIVSDVLELPSDRIHLGRTADEPSGVRAARGRPVIVGEHEMRFVVRLDRGVGNTGLELDLRTLRDWIRRDAAGKRVLNLFSRGGTFAVAAASGGAAATVSVDASRTWNVRARENFDQNGMTSQRHQLVCHDPLAVARELAEREFDLAVVEAPAFDGRRRSGEWNVQDDHVALIADLAACLSPGGRLYFVSRFRRLTLRSDQIAGVQVHEITRQSVPADFRNKKIHRAWSMLRSSDS
jgi:23S rRNA (guanine2445-N2)-methyltransferase / 23S rRNA (guanine2069-N7)-methyltransferase